MNKKICVRETFDWIYIGNNENEITFEEKELIRRYLEKTVNTEDKIIEEKYGRFRFVNFVGIIKIKNITIEIVPKISFNDDRDKDKKMLLSMISKCNDIDINLDSIINTRRGNYNIVEHILNKYVEVLLKEINIGLYREYVNIQNDLNTVKGKIIFKENLKNKCSRNNKINCKFEEYSEDNTINQILKLACIKYMNNTQNHDLQNKFKKAVFHFGNVTSTELNKEIIKKTVVNKQSKRFEKSLELAKFILLNLSNVNSTGQNRGFSMIFNIDLLYEKYITKLIKKICLSNNKKAIYKDRKNYLLIDKANNNLDFNIVPDILIERNNIPEIIINLKWKAVEQNSKLTYDKNDIYEMYTYINTYKESKKIIYLYPDMNIDREYPVWSLSENSDKLLQISTVRLDEFSNTIEDLERILL